jgi:hypothetical protein
MNLKRKSRTRYYASMERVGFPKSKQSVELFEAPEGILNDGSGAQGSSTEVSVSGRNAL